MLYIIYRDNHPDMAYHGGQVPILHLLADLESVMNWAESRKTRWAFSDRNAVNATDFRDPMVKEGKQAEFLVHEVFPWQLVEKIGVINTSMLNQVTAIIQDVDYKPVVQVERAWYY